MTACPERLPMLHGLTDGELDAANSLAIEAHIKGCRGCAEALRELEAVRAAIGGASARYRTPGALRDRVDTILEAATERPARRFGGNVGRYATGAIFALAASLLLVVATPQMMASGDQDQFVSSHVRSLLANHLVDVQTSNRHVVKPWFNGRIDFAPPVVELADRGFPLVGGRLDYIDGQVVPAIVYRRRLHMINLFVRPAAGIVLPVARTMHHDGYSIVHWCAAGFDYWAVSDIDGAELEQFRQAFAARVAK
ncbi:Transmembrane transcriptional regulator (anti-sigma factor RsiW) [Sphingomonas sp. YR710]|uniref:anti-sigma factor family protein n=1 Tax=Sphingomonas sp. YR710 TaxID=1882773 RepID=UPI00088AA842|nr:anti-sigma factor [Sphingomonas sp. YR710]SDC98711.1 Transmembrane transcriptional regulator (anti-sigma factor RsiW) [Sphingomonas sp. YR710]